MIHVAYYKLSQWMNETGIIQCHKLLSFTFYKINNYYYLHCIITFGKYFPTKKRKCINMWMWMWMKAFFIFSPCTRCDNRNYLKLTFLISQNVCILFSMTEIISHRLTETRKYLNISFIFNLHSSFTTSN